MMTLDHNETFTFIKLIFWYIKFNKLYTKLKLDYLELDPINDFLNENEYLEYSNTLSWINKNNDLISHILELILNNYKLNDDHLCVEEYRIMFKEVNKITKFEYINREKDKLVSQWNEIIDTIIDFLGVIEIKDI